MFTNQERKIMETYKELDENTIQKNRKPLNEQNNQLEDLVDNIANKINSIHFTTGGIMGMKEQMALLEDPREHVILLENVLINLDTLGAFGEMLEWFEIEVVEVWIDDIAPLDDMLPDAFIYMSMEWKYKNGGQHDHRMHYVSNDGGETWMTR